MIRTRKTRKGSRFFSGLFATLVVGLGVLSVGSGQQSRGGAAHSDEDHARRIRRTRSPAEVLKDIADPSFAARVREVRLRGFLERADGTSRLALDEHAVWPDRYERRVTESGGTSWLRLEAGKILAGPERGQRNDTLPPALVRLRLRSLFVIRHLANAVARGAVPRPFDRKGEKLQAFDVRDGYGPFRVLVGGLAGGLQGVQEGSDAVYFTAQVRSGPWMYPASQAAVTSDRLLEIVRVTSTETTPQGP